MKNKDTALAETVYEILYPVAIGEPRDVGGNLYSDSFVIEERVPVYVSYNEDDDLCIHENEDHTVTDDELVKEAAWRVRREAEGREMAREWDITFKRNSDGSLSVGISLMDLL